MERSRRADPRNECIAELQANEILTPSLPASFPKKWTVLEDCHLKWYAGRRMPTESQNLRSALNRRLRGGKTD